MGRKRKGDFAVGGEDFLFEEESGGEERTEAMERAKKTLEEAFEQIDARQIDKQLIAERLKRAVVADRGQQPFARIAGCLGDKTFKLMQTLRSDHRCHQLTGCLLHESALYTADKSGRVIRWTVNSDGLFKKQHVFRAPGAVCAMAVVGTALFCGLTSGKLYAVDTKTHQTNGIDQTSGHRMAITGMAITNDMLYTVSADRTVKQWAIDQQAYLDTLFGHQDEVMGVCAVPGDQTRLVSVGSRDRSLRLWKVDEESQLVFRLPEADPSGSLDAVAVVSTGDDSFVVATGSDSGSISLWSLGRKRPIATFAHAHSASISFLYAVKSSDLVISGSNGDGFVRFWQVDGKSITCVQELAVPGCIVAGVMEKTTDGYILILAVSSEPRLGRWDTDKSLKPSILVFKLE